MSLLPYLAKGCGEQSYFTSYTVIIVSSPWQASRNEVQHSLGLQMWMKCLVSLWVPCFLRRYTGLSGYIFQISCASSKHKWLFGCLCLLWWQGTPALPQAGIPTEALVKGPVSRMPIEESSPEKVREEAASKGHVIYEGKSGHILSYDSKYCLFTDASLMIWDWKQGLIFLPAHYV